jgi:hypothetical protein
MITKQAISHYRRQRLLASCAALGLLAVLPSFFSKITVVAKMEREEIKVYY